MFTPASAVAVRQRVDSICLQVVLEGKTGFLWGFGALFFGSPVACVYLIQKAYQGPISFVQGASEGSKYC